VELPTTLIGMSFSSGTVRKLELTRTSYSNSPIFCGWPEGRMTFLLLDGVKDVLRRKPLRLKKRWA